MRHFLLYRIKNKHNDKIYVGKHITNNVDDGYMGSGKLIKRAISRYGIENFTKEIIGRFESEQELNAAEQKIVTEEFCLRRDTYNMVPGGNGGFWHINSAPLISLAATKAGQAAADKVLKIKYGPEWQRVLASIAGKIVVEKKLGIHALPKSERTNFKNNPEIQMKALDRSTSRCARTKRIETMRSIGHQKGSKNSRYGTVWVTNGIETVSIKASDAADWLRRGFWRGRTLRKST